MKRDKDGKFYSTKQELRLAQDIGGRRQTASGALWGGAAKGDVRSMGVVRQEAKWTAANYFSLQASEFRKIRSVAEASGETAVFLIEYRNDSAVIVLSDQEPEGDFGIRKETKVKGLSFRIKAEDVQDLDRESFRETTSYLWQLSFRKLELFAFSYKTFQEAFC